MALTYEQVEVSSKTDNFCYKSHSYSLQEKEIAKWKGKEVRLAISSDKNQTFNPLKRLICLIYGVLLKIGFQRIAAQVWLKKGLTGKQVIVIVSPADHSPYCDKTAKQRKILNPKNLVLPLSPKEIVKFHGKEKNAQVTPSATPALHSPLPSTKNSKENAEINELINFCNLMAHQPFEELDFATFERIEGAIDRIHEMQAHLSPANPLLLQLIDAFSQLMKQKKAIELIFEFKALFYELSPPGLKEKAREKDVPETEDLSFFSETVEKQSFMLVKWQQFLAQKGILAQEIQKPNALKAALKAYRQEVFSAHQALHKKLKGRKIQWIIGSRSAALPLMEKVSQIVDKTGKRIFNTPALVSTGTLLHYKLAPLTGDLGLGMSPLGVSKENVLGMAMNNFKACWAYTQNSRRLFNAHKEINTILNYSPTLGRGTNRLKIAVLRLMLMRQQPKQWPRLRNHIQTKILANALQAETLSQKSPLEEGWKAKGKLIGIPFAKRGRKIDEKEILNRGQIVVVPRSSGEKKLGMVCEAIAQEDTYHYTVLVEIEGGGKRSYTARKIRIPHEEDLIELFQTSPALNSTHLITLKNLLRTPSQEIRKILKLFNQVKPLELSTNQASLIQNSFPLLWGSSTIEAKNCSSGTPGERLAAGNLELGKDIQFAFTDEKHIDALKEAVAPHGVTVLTVQEGLYLTQ